MTTQTQTEAQKLADDLNAEFVAGRISNHTGRKVALELHRLEVANAELLKALQKSAQSNYRCMVQIGKK